jgi:hypothetical protein
MPHCPNRRRYLATVMSFLLIAVGAASGWAAGPLSAEEEARVRREWEQVRQNYERVLRAHERRLADIDAKEGGRAADPEVRAEKITRERAAGIMVSRKEGGKGSALASMATRAMSSPTTWGEIDKAQDEYVERVTREWSGERKALQEALAALQKNAQLISAYLAAVTEATEAMSMRVRQSGVLEKAARNDAAARETGDRLSARWERERAARERERAQREREAGERERARGRP